jgi:molybdopterin/thiamine biosynthesis adenylyltransferase
VSDMRYSRQILFQGIGQEGQKRIQNSHAAIIGMGALGSASAEMLVRAGVGKLTIVDRDYVELSNLHRQQLYTEIDAKENLPKVMAAKKRLEAINRDVVIDAKLEEANPNTLESLLPVDVIIDGLDNFETRMMINDFAQKHQIPWIYGACVASYGVSLSILPGETPCLHCLMEEIPLNGENCDTVGIISPAVQMVSTYQVAEALKIIAGQKQHVRKTLISFDLWKNEFSQINVLSLKKAECPSCGNRPSYPFLKYENWGKAEVLCGRNAVQIRPGHQHKVNLPALREKFEIVNENPYLLVLQLEGKRVVLFRDGRAIIHGESDQKHARALYQKYIGG